MHASEARFMMQSIAAAHTILAQDRAVVARLQAELVVERTWLPWALKKIKKNVAAGEMRLDTWFASPSDYVWKELYDNLIKLDYRVRFDYQALYVWWS